MIRRSTERTAAGVQYLAPWAASLMDTTGRLRAPKDAPERPMPLFTQDEDAAARALAASQRSIFEDSNR